MADTSKEATIRYFEWLKSSYRAQRERLVQKVEDAQQEVADLDSAFMRAGPALKIAKAELRAVKNAPLHKKLDKILKEVRKLSLK